MFAFHNQSKNSLIKVKSDCTSGCESRRKELHVVCVILLDGKITSIELQVWYSADYLTYAPKLKLLAHFTAPEIRDEQIGL
jgi:hypothetical protein